MTTAAADVCSAHAGYAPWDGVNALDAAFVAYAGISALRQQIRPDQRVHGVISGRDWTPNGSFNVSSPHLHTPVFLHAPTPPDVKEKWWWWWWWMKHTSLTSDADFFFFFFFFFFCPGLATQVIPDYAKMSWSVRADVWDALEPLRERVVHCLECATRLFSRCFLVLDKFLSSANNHPPPPTCATVIPACIDPARARRGVAMTSC